MVVWHQPQLGPCAIVWARHRNNQEITHLLKNNEKTLSKQINNLYIILWWEKTIYCDLHLCCQQLWSPGCSHGGAWWSDRFLPHGTRSAPLWMRRSSPPRHHPSNVLATPPQNALYQWFLGGRLSGPPSAGQTGADLLKGDENREQSSAAFWYTPVSTTTSGSKMY